MLSSNKIHVVSLNDSIKTKIANLEHSNKNRMNITSEAQNSNAKLNISEVNLHQNNGENELEIENHALNINKVDNPNNEGVNKNSHNWIEIKADLSKEPRIEKDKNIGNTKEGKTPENQANNDPQQSGVNKEVSSQPTKHVIPTFFNKKIQEAIYKYPNKSSISGSTSSNIVTTTRPPSSTTKISTTTIPNGVIENAIDDVSLSIPQSPSCGKLGGAAIFQAFGKLSQKLMPNLVANWVTGQNGKHQKEKDKRARIDLSGEFDKEGTEPRIIAGMLF